LGSAQFGSDYGIANKYGKVKYTEIKKILSFAYKKGINTIDTASGYGISEQIIGKYLNDNPEQRWSIITKLSGPLELFKKQIRTSIIRLGRKPDVVLAHSISDLFKPSLTDIISWLKDEMGIKKIGVSVYGNDEIEKVLTYAKMDVIQCPLNALDTRLYRNGVLDDIKSNELELHVRSVFLQGLFFLSDKKLKQNFFDALPHIKKLRTISKDLGLTLAELSLLWVHSLDQVDKVIIGVDNVQQLNTHYKTLNNKNKIEFTKQVTSIIYDNENILNPSLWLQ